MNRVVSRLGFTALVLASGAVPAMSQSATTGMVTGKVTDGTGAPLQGARVIITGAGLQGARESISNADGTYRLALIPSGSGYSVKISKQGYSASEAKNVSIAAFATVAQNFSLKAAAVVSATVEVVSSASTIDATSVTTMKAFNPTVLQALPLASRDYTAAAFLTPGVVDSGRGDANPAMAGGSGFENSVLIDGLNSTDPVYGRNEVKMNSLAIESVQIQTGGFEPEYGRSTGGIISAVTKSGGNDFAAEFETTVTPGRTAALATGQSALNFNANKNQQGKIITSALWLGGAIIKDKLWYSVGVSTSTSDNYQSAGAPYILDPSLTPNIGNPLARPISGDSAKSQKQTTLNNGLLAKLTWTINTDNTVELAVNSSRNTNENPTANGSLYTLSTTNPKDQKFKQNNDVDIFSGNWRANLSSSWLLDVRVGLYNRKTKNDEGSAGFERPTIGFSNASFSSAATRAYGGLRIGGPSITGTSDITRKQMTIKGTNFFGAHTLKYGLDYDETGYKSFSRYPGEFQITRFANVNALTGATTSFTDRYRFRTGANGTQLYRNTAPGDPLNPVTGGLTLRNGNGLDLDSKTKNMAYFIQDAWQVTPTFQVIGGIRIDSQDLYGGDGALYHKFKPSEMTAPRLGFTWDVEGNGKSKLSGNFGRFYETIPMDLNQRAGSIEGFATVQRTYSGANANVFFIPTPTQIVGANGVMNGADAGIGGGTVTLRSAQGGELSAIQDDIKPQGIEEIGFGYERQITDQWKMGVNWKYRYFVNVVEDYSFDNGNTYVIGNPGQNGVGLLPALIEEYDYPGQSENIYFPKPVRHYRELTASVNKEKGASKWTLGMQYTFATKEGNIDGLDASPQTGQVDPNITAFYDLPTLTRGARGPLPGSVKYNFQVTGTYDLPWNFSLGARFLYRAGTPISAFGPDLGPLTRETEEIPDPSTPDPDDTLTVVVPDSYYMYNGQFLHDGNYGDGQAFLEPRGSRGVTPDVTRTDIHIEWNSAAIWKNRLKATFFIDIFNLFNEQTTLTVNQTKQFQTAVTGSNVNSGGTTRPPARPNSPASEIGLIAVDNPNFLRPTSFQAPRSLQFGMRLKF